MYCVRQIFAFALVLTIAGGGPATTARADTPNPDIVDLGQALDFVDGLATEAYETLNDKALSAEQREQRLHSLLDRGFNVRYIALMALGPYCSDMPPGEMQEYESRFEDFLFNKYLDMVESYGVAKFHTLEAERAGRRDALVHIMLEHGGGAVETDWRVRIFDGEPKIIDVKLSGLSLTENEREQVSDLIRQSGLAGLMTRLRSYASDKRA